MTRGGGPMTEPTVLMTAEELAREARLTPRELLKLARRGLVPGVTRIGRRVRFRRVAALTWLEAGCPAPGPEVV